jgi:hypothetical protein
MTIADAYRRLGAVLSGLESQGIEVDAVTPDEATGEEPLVVDLRITVPSDPDAPEVRFGDSPPPESAGADGGPRTATAEATPSPDGADPESDSGTASAADGEIDTTDSEYPCGESGCPAAFDSEAALTVHRLSQHDRPEEPLHQHDPALRAAYAAYDSFSSMTEALDVDVTAQTVRRNMMKAGIHDPEADGRTDGDEAAREDEADGESARENGSSTDDDAAEAPDSDGDDDADGVQDPDGSAGEEQPIADGSGAAADPGAAASGDATGGSPAPGSTPADPAAQRLPEDVTVGALRDAVVEGGSLRAVARQLDRSSGEARALLDELGLLEQVHGRVATRPDRDQRAAAFDDWVEACRSDDPSGESERPDG